MNAAVVYESHWGNTAAIARAIAEGIGQGARALTTDEASGEALAGVDLVVAGAPLMALRLGSEKTLKGIVEKADKTPTPDVAHPAMRTWLEQLPRGQGRSAAFETRLRWSPGGATSTIEKGLASAGYRPLAKAHRFVVKGSYGPLRDGELERARQWGAELAETLRIDAATRA